MLKEALRYREDLLKESLVKVGIDEVPAKQGAVLFIRDFIRAIESAGE